MKNDSRNFELVNGELGLMIEVDGEAISIEDINSYVKAYIREFEISPVGMLIVMTNASRNIAPPSGKGTMYNLYQLGRLFYIRQSDNAKGYRREGNGNPRVLPQPLEKFLLEYHLQNNLRGWSEYRKYLEINTDVHHYGELNTWRDFFTAEIVRSSK